MGPSTLSTRTPTVGPSTLTTQVDFYSRNLKSTLVAKVDANSRIKVHSGGKSRC
jgi:hypothetical protein